MMWLAPAGAAVAAFALVITVGLPTGGSSPAGPGPVASGQRGELTVSMDARAILLAAATAARTEPVAVPEAKSYVYSRITGKWQSFADEASPGPMVQETWLAVDGRRPGLSVETTGKGAKAQRLKQDLPPCPGTPTEESIGELCGGPGYLADVPQNAGDAVTYLRKPASMDLYPSKANCSWAWDQGVRCEPGTNVDIFFSGGFTSLYRLMSPASRAAIFEGLSTLSGITVLPRPVTVGDHSGVGLMVENTRRAGDPDAGLRERFTLVFDRVSHEVVGYREETFDDKAGGKLVSVGEGAVEAVRAVPKIGVRPDGTAIS
jgi:hypothetical protein